MQENLGDYLRKIRKEKKFKLTSFAYKNGLEPSTLSRIETGKIDPRYSSLLKIASGFGLKLSELIENFENQT